MFYGGISLTTKIQPVLEQKKTWIDIWLENVNRNFRNSTQCFFFAGTVHRSVYIILPVSNCLAPLMLAPGSTRRYPQRSEAIDASMLERKPVTAANVF